MSKFQIIEEGRISLSEMGDVIGGKTCQENSYHTTVDCMPGVNLYSSCGIGYESCIGPTMVSCGSSYKGPAGPAGRNDQIIGPAPGL